MSNRTERPITASGLAVGVILVVWTAVNVFSADKTPGIDSEPRLSDLGQYIESSLLEWDMPGLAVAVVLDDKVVFAQGFGIKELGKDDAVDPKTLFQIGSTTKAFAAATLGALVDDGLLEWDDPVVTHLPWFTLKDPSVTRNVTIRDLLAHRSGMPAHAFPALTLLNAREVAERARMLDNQTPLREEFRYSNQAYGIAGLIVEEVTGTDWGDWLKERILNPLQMSDSEGSPYNIWGDSYVAPAFLGTAPRGQVGIADAPEMNVAMPHGVDRDGVRRVLPWQSYDNLQAAGSMVSNVMDMANWLIMQVNAGVFEGVQVLNATTVQEMHAPQISSQSTFLFTDEGRPVSYGMGWTRETFNGKTYLSHGGGIFGFPAYAALLPEIKAGIVVLANGSTWTPYYPHQEITARVFSRLLDLEDKDWKSRAMTQTQAILEQVDQIFAAQEAARAENTEPTLPLSEYLGTYTSDVSGPFNIFMDGDRMRLQFEGVGAFSGELEHWHHDDFRLFFDGGDGQAYGSSLVTFTVDTQETVQQLELGAFGVYRPATQ